MRSKLVILLFAAFALSACETPPEEKASATGTGMTKPSAAAPAPAPVISSLPPPSGPIPGTQEDLVVNVGDRVFFDLDKYDLKPKARETLEKQAAWLERNRQITVTIQGHADERGTREYNLALGERRANSIRDYLVALGVDPNRLKTISFGKERPVDPRSTEEAWAKNRRGVMVVD